MHTVWTLPPGDDDYSNRWKVIKTCRELVEPFAFDCMDAYPLGHKGGRATQGAVAECKSCHPPKDVQKSGLPKENGVYTQGAFMTFRLQVATSLASASSAQVWEHTIHNDNDYSRHVDYVHWNPMKHGLVGQVKDLPKGMKALFQLPRLYKSRALPGRLGGQFGLSA